MELALRESVRLSLSLSQPSRSQRCTPNLFFFYFRFRRRFFPPPLYPFLFSMSDGLGPHLNGSRGAGHHRHHSQHQDSAIENDEEVIETSSRNERRGSRATSHSTRHRFMNAQTSSVHDKHDRPIRRHGHETFGDALMHPFREYELHKQRVKEYEEELKKWERWDEEKSQRSAPFEAAPTRPT